MLRYYDNQGRPLTTEEYNQLALKYQNQIDEQFREENNPSKKKNGLFATLQLTTIGLFAQNTVQQPFLKRIDFGIGKFVQNKMPVNDQLQKRLGTVGENITTSRNNLFLNSIIDTTDISLTNRISHALFDNKQFTQYIQKYVYQTAGNYIAYNTVQSVTGQERESNIFKFMLFENNLMLQGKFGKRALLKTDFGKNINDYIINANRNVQVNINQLSKTLADAYEKEIAGKAQFNPKNIRNLSNALSNYYNYIKENFKPIKDIQRKSLEAYIWSDVINIAQANNILKVQPKTPTSKEKELIDSTYESLQGLVKERSTPEGISLREVIDNLETFKINDNLKSTIKSLENIDKYIKNVVGNKTDILDAPIFNFLTKTSSGKLVYKSKSTGEQLFNLNEFQTNFKIPFLDFNPVQLFQTRTSLGLYTRSLVQELDPKTYLGQSNIKLQSIKEILNDDNIKQNIKSLINADEQSTPLQNQFFKFQIPLRNRKYLSEDFEVTLDFLENNRLYEFKDFDTLIKDVSAAYKPIDENNVLKDIIYNAKTKEFEHIFNFSQYATRTGEIKTFFETELMPDNPLEPISKNITNNVDYNNEIYSIGLTINDSYYYALNTTDLGSSLLKTLSLEQKSYRLENKETESKIWKFIKEHDLLFNQSYSFSKPIHTEWLESIKMFGSTNRLYNKGLQRFKETGSLKPVAKLMELYNINASNLISPSLLKNFDISIDKSNINSYVREYMSSFQYFEDLGIKLNKLKTIFAVNKKNIEFFQNILPTPFEKKQYYFIKHKINSKQYIDYNLLTTKVTAIGQTMEELMDKTITLQKIIDMEEADFKEQLSKLATESEKSFGIFAEMIRHLNRSLESVNVGPTPYEVLEEAFYNIQFDRTYNLDEFNLLRNQISNQLRYQPGIKKRILEKAREEEYNLKTGMGTVSNVILRSSNAVQGSSNGISNKYNVPTVQRLFTHYFVDRPTQLLEELGLGRPNPNPKKQPSTWPKIFQNAWNYTVGASNDNAYGQIASVMFKRVLPVYLGFQAFKQIDQQLTDKTGEEVPIYVPSKLLAETYTSFVQGLLKFGDILQVDKIIEFIDFRFPNILPLSLSMLQQKDYGASEIFMFGAFSTLLSKYKDPEQYALEVTGNKNVPIRQSRFWEFGRTPYLGGEIKYFRPHLQHIVGSQWEYTDVLWGSSQEYLKHGNIYGQILTLNPFKKNYLAEKHIIDRPYPDTNLGLYSNVPVLGNYIAGQQQFVTKQDIHPYFVDNNEFNNIYKTINRSSLAKPFNNQINQIQDYLGFTGFMSKFTNPFASNELKGPELASPSLMYGNRLYYQMELGGLLGYTEFFRRIVNNNESIYGNQYYNPIPNLLFQSQYNWLPENYYLDFYHGDVYSKIPYGEIRFPGAGYEQTHKTTGMYNELEQFEIIANVAPYSANVTRTYNKYKKHDEQLPYYERYRIYRQYNEADQVRHSMITNEYPFSSITKKASFNVERIDENGLIYVNEENVPVRLQGVDLNIDQIAQRIFETENVQSIQEAYSEAKKRRDEIINSIGKKISGEVWADENQRYEIDEQGNVNLVLMNQQIAKIAKKNNMPYDENDRQDVRQRYKIDIPFISTLQLASEQFTHNFGFLFEKFGGPASQLEQYQRYEVYGTRSQNWSNPVNDFLKHSFFNTINLPPLETFTHSIGMGYLFGNNLQTKMLASVFNLGATLPFQFSPNNIIPQSTKERYELEEKYMLQKQARGERSLYGYSALQSDTPKELISLLPKNERDYIQYFVNAPENTLNQARKVQPSYTNFVLDQIERYKQAQIAGEYTQQLITSRDQREYLEEQYNGEYYLESEYLNPYVDLDKMYALEVYSEFDDTRKFSQYTDDLYKQYQSILKTEFNNNQITSSFRGIGTTIASMRNYTNSNINMYVNMNQQNGTYAY